MFTEKCAWIKQAVGARNTCVPAVRITVKGPFGTVEMEAAMSCTLPPHYPYLLFNRSDQILCEKGQLYGEDGVSEIITISEAHELAPQEITETSLADVNCGSETQEAKCKNTCVLEQQECTSMKAEAQEAAVETCEIVGEALCQQSTTGTARPAVTELTQSLCVFVTVAPSEEVQILTR